MAQSCQARFRAPVHGSASSFLPMRHTAHPCEWHGKWAGIQFDAPADTGCPVLVARSSGRFLDKARSPSGWLVSVSASPLQSIAASAQSWSPLYRAWSSGSLTRSVLRDYADPQTVEQYLSQASVSTSPCSLRTITSACTVFSPNPSWPRMEQIIKWTLRRTFPLSRRLQPRIPHRDTWRHLREMRLLDGRRFPLRCCFRLLPRLSLSLRVARVLAEGERGALPLGGRGEMMVERPWRLVLVLRWLRDVSSSGCGFCVMCLWVDPVKSVF